MSDMEKLLTEAIEADPTATLKALLEHSNAQIGRIVDERLSALQQEQQRREAERAWRQEVDDAVADLMAEHDDFEQLAPKVREMIGNTDALDEIFQNNPRKGLALALKLTRLEAAEAAAKEKMAKAEQNPAPKPTPGASETDAPEKDALPGPWAGMEPYCAGDLFSDEHAAAWAKRHPPREPKPSTGDPWEDMKRAVFSSNLFGE